MWVSLAKPSVSTALLRKKFMYVHKYNTEVSNKYNANTIVQIDDQLFLVLILTGIHIGSVRRQWCHLKPYWRRKRWGEEVGLGGEWKETG